MMRRASFVASQLLTVGVLACNAFDEVPRREVPTPVTPGLPTPVPTVTTPAPPPPTADAPNLTPRPLCAVFLDRDGDGVAVSDISGCLPEDGFVVDAKGEDCDDFDATRSKTVGYGSDYDGDGYGGYLLEWLCEGTISEGLVPNTSDCDDHDESVQLFMYSDADGDGQGAPSRCPSCEAADASGFAPNMLDCDDQAAASYQGAVGEVAYDDLDTDCDGVDLPWLTINEPADLGTFALEPWCSGPVLAIAAVGQTPGIQPEVTLQVVNVGTTRVGPASLVVNTIGTDRTISDTVVFAIPSLDPGGVYLQPALVVGQYQAVISYDAVSTDVGSGAASETSVSETASSLVSDAGEVGNTGPDGSMAAPSDAAVSFEGDASVVLVPLPEFDGPRCELLKAPLPILNQAREVLPL